MLVCCIGYMGTIGVSVSCQYAHKLAYALVVVSNSSSSNSSSSCCCYYCSSNSSY